MGPTMVGAMDGVSGEWVLHRRVPVVGATGNILHGVGNSMGVPVVGATGGLKTVEWGLHGWVLLGLQSIALVESFNSTS